MSETLSNLAHEERRFSPPEQFAAQANVKADAYAEADGDRLAFWAKQAERLSWAEKWTEVLDWSDPPFAKWFVGGKLNVAYNCVDRHVEDGHGDQVAYHWEGEPGETRAHHLRRTQGRGLQGGQRADRARRADRRPHRDLHADDPRDGDRDAGLRAARCAAHGGVRRLLVHGAVRPDHRLRRACRDHVRRRLPARCAVGAEAGGRRGAAEVPGRPHGRRRQAHRPGRRVDRGPRRLVGGRRRQAVHRAHTRSLRRRAPAVRHVHVGVHGQAEGHPAHGGRLPHPGGVHAPRGVRPQAGRGPVLVRRRHRLDHRPQLHRLRAAGQPGDVLHVRGCAEQPGRAPLVEDDREVQDLDPLHRAHHDPDVHEVGRGHPQGRTTSPRCACSAPSANRSTPRPGSGTARTSAATAARSSTPGGRPRPARS